MVNITEVQETIDQIPLEEQRFAIKTTKVSGLINDINTDVLITAFVDKFFVIITQLGKFGSLVHLSL